MDSYIFDKKKSKFVRRKPGVRAILLAVLRYLAASLLAAVLFYLVFATVFNTEREALLKKENRLLAMQLENLNSALPTVEYAVEHLRVRDRKIYNDIFKSDPPNYIVESRDTLLEDWDNLEQAAESDLVWDAFAMAGRAEIRARQVSDALDDILAVFSSENFSPGSIPSVVPVEKYSPIQTGASVGKKVNPFLKTVRDHNGLDLLAPAGTVVRSSASGRVVKVEKSGKGMGNKVEIEHPGGFRTVYCHLNRINVSAGQDVKQGQAIGDVGQTGSCFAPCLHYEVIRGGVHQDPLNYFFAELDPSTYREMTIVAHTTGQSMD